MKKKLLCILTFVVSAFVAQAQATLFSTDFSTTTGVTWSATGADLTSTQASGGDFSWVTATTYCYFASTGTFTFPAITYTGADSLIINWGIHDSGRNIEVLDGATTLTTLTAGTDQMTRSAYSLGSSITGSKTLSLNITDGALVITSIKVTSGTASSCAAPKASELSVYGIDGGIRVENLCSKSVSIYDVAGNLISTKTLSGNNVTIPVAKAGLYVIASEGAYKKVIVK
jgi:hypothetical protein